MTTLGWCPSTHRLFRARDGLLARVKVPGGALRLEQLRTLARAAEQTGNGQLEFTSRANVQLRGIRDESVSEMRDLLRGVGLHDSDPARENRRNVMAAPAAGLDDDEIVDVRPYVATVLATLDALDPELELTHKFGVLLDGGGTPSLGGISNDLALGAARDANGALVFRVALGHCLDEGTDFIVDTHELSRLVDVVARHCASPPSPLRPGRAAALSTQLAPRTWRELLNLQVATRDATDLAVTRRTNESSPPRWRMLHHTDATLCARDITTLCELLVTLDLDELRLTPWRAVLFGPLAIERELPPVTGWSTLVGCA